ncbi:unnamed protein product [Angiostrongylus costaricensis]|uniref:Secreted protein n=1 Tax=Angiostrongylus costaricensis TaxID=334426 RepID=A0A0R3PXQ5_ANGCS|nr:unnamed protein product [Angiostrongylus costaricensis]
MWTHVTAVGRCLLADGADSRLAAAAVRGRITWVVLACRRRATSRSGAPTTHLMPDRLRPYATVAAHFSFI